MELVGTAKGLALWEISRDIMSHTASLRGDQDAPVLTVVAPPSWEMQAYNLAKIRSDPKSVGYSFSGNVGFRPFDEEAELPGRLIIYPRHCDFDVTAWAADHLGIPETVEVTFDHDSYKGKLHAFARTMKNGRVAMIRKKVTDELPIAKAFAPILTYYTRNCPRIDESAPERTCGAHLAAILERLDQYGRQRIREWFEAMKDRPGYYQKPDNLVIDGDMLPGTGITTLTLKVTQKSNAVECEIRIDGNHLITDDAEGITVAVNAMLPETVLSALKGESLARIFDLPWADKIKIRVARAPKDNQVSLRAYTDGVPFNIDGPAPQVANAAERIKKAIEGEHPRWATADKSLEPILSSLDADQLASMFAILGTPAQVDLTMFGHPGWIVKNCGNRLEVESCPEVPMSEIVKAVLGRKIA